MLDLRRVWEVYAPHGSDVKIEEVATGIAIITIDQLSFRHECKIVYDPEKYQPIKDALGSGREYSWYSVLVVSRPGLTQKGESFAKFDQALSAAKIHLHCEGEIQWFKQPRRYQPA